MIEQDQPDEQELAQEAEVALRYRRDRRHHEEHGRGHAAGERDQLAAVPEARRELKHRRQHHARTRR